MKDRIKKYAESLGNLAAFSEKYDLGVHETYVLTILRQDCASVHIDVGIPFPQTTRGKVISNIGNALGCDGWKREKNSHRLNHIDWTKTVDGVHVRIESAQVIVSTHENTPIDWTEFPTDEATELALAAKEAGGSI